MQVEQITYGSINRSRMKGYQIIGKSPGVDTVMSSSFCQWAPSHNSLEFRSDKIAQDAWGLCCFALSEFHYAIARSVHGAPEYSGRGGFAVVTSALILSRKQFAAYDFQAVNLTRTAIVFGNLILQTATDEILPQVTLPRQAVALPPPVSYFTDSAPALLPDHVVNGIARESVSLLRGNRKVMIVGKCDPLPILSVLLNLLTPQERGTTSFACGLKPSSRRDFRIQFTCHAMSPRIRKELDRSGIAAIDVARSLVEAD